MSKPGVAGSEEAHRAPPGTNESFVCSCALASPEPDQSEAEACFRRALAVAHEQQAKFWELRAATSLARLSRDQRRRNEAHDLLAPIYGWFSQEFDMADLTEAKALLDELS